MEVLLFIVLAVLALAVTVGDADYIGAIYKTAQAIGHEEMLLVIDPQPEPAAAPGLFGSIVVSQGMLDATQTEGELVGVLTHEIARTIKSGLMQWLTYQTFMHKDTMAIIAVMMCTRPKSIEGCMYSLLAALGTTALTIPMAIFHLRRMTQRPLGLMGRLGLLVSRVNKWVGFWPLAMLLLFFATPSRQDLAYTLLVWVGLIIVSGYTFRDVEFQIDTLGMKIMVGAGVNPREYQALLERLPEIANPSGPKHWFFGTVPTMRSRIAEIDRTLTGWETSRRRPNN